MYLALIVIPSNEPSHFNVPVRFFVFPLMSNKLMYTCMLGFCWTSTELMYRLNKFIIIVQNKKFIIVNLDNLTINLLDLNMGLLVNLIRLPFHVELPLPIFCHVYVLA